VAESDLHVADIIWLESAVDELARQRNIYRQALFAALDLLHGAALRLNDQEQQLRQFFVTR